MTNSKNSTTEQTHMYLRGGVVAAPGYMVGGLGITRNIMPISSQLRENIDWVIAKSATTQTSDNVLNDGE